MKYFEKKLSYPQFLLYLVPSVLNMIFLSFYTTIDGFFVSKYAGSDALAGINIVIPITCVIFGVSVMLATGAGAIIGERLGQKREREANEIFSFICLVLLGLSLLFTVGGHPAAEAHLPVAGQQSAVAAPCAALCPGDFPGQHPHVLQAVLRVSGAHRRPPQYGHGHVPDGSCVQCGI